LQTLRCRRDFQQKISTAPGGSSWRGLVLTPILIAALAWRIVRQKRTLRAELPGSDEYTARVRYRLIPYVW
jgi:protein-S-isoprenylcysteine O-methyltransferase Ste14